MATPSRPLRIAHVTATFPPYLAGAGNVAAELADRQARRGHRVQVFTALAPGPALPSAATVHRLRPVFAIGNAPFLPALASLRDVDVIHLQHPFIFGTELLQLARLRGPRPRIVVQYANRLIGEGLRRPLFWAWERTWGRLLLRTADRIGVVSLAHGDSVPDIARIRRRATEKVVETPNGVDLRRFVPGTDDGELRERHGIPADAIVVAYVTALDRAHWLKRPDLAIEAVARAGDERLHLLMVGGGEWVERLRNHARAAGIAERTTFIGPLGHATLPAALRASDFLLNTSDLESFGMVLVEALACGRPVVSTATVGARSIVEDGRTGILAPIGDVEALADGLRAMASLPPSDRARMGTLGRRVVEQRYDWERIVDRLDEIYADILA
jgi:glycosyltransferase involved in cell wall biosynthesis